MITIRINILIIQLILIAIFTFDKLRSTNYYCCALGVDYLFCAKLIILVHSAYFNSRVTDKSLFDMGGD